MSARGLSLRLVFFGTPVAASVALTALHDEHDVVLVVTRPDKRRGRGGHASESSVAVMADVLGLPVRKPARAGELTDEVRALGADLGVVVAYGQLIPPPLLAAFPLGLVNVHYSVLPRWRGAAPVERAILAGDTETGVCVMQLDDGLDTGPVYACERTPIAPEDTAGDLHDRLSAIGTDLLIRTLPEVATRTPEPQVGEPTYADKLSVEEFRLDPSRPASELVRVVRAANPRPGAWMQVNGRRIKVLRAHAEASPTGAGGEILWPGELLVAGGSLFLDEVQVEGKRPMSGEAWMNGLRSRELTIDQS